MLFSFWFVKLDFDRPAIPFSQFPAYRVPLASPLAAHATYKGGTPPLSSVESIANAAILAL